MGDSGSESVSYLMDVQINPPLSQSHALRDAPLLTSQKKKKRNIEEILSPETAATNVAFAKFFVVEAAAQENAAKFGNLSPFVIEKVLHGSIGSVQSCKKLRGGGLLLEVDTKKKAEQLLLMKVFFGIDVKLASTEP